MYWRNAIVSEVWINTVQHSEELTSGVGRYCNSISRDSVHWTGKSCWLQCQISWIFIFGTFWIIKYNYLVILNFRKGFLRPHCVNVILVNKKCKRPQKKILLTCDSPQSWMVAIGINFGCDSLLAPQFYIQLLYEPYLITWILLVGPFGQPRAVRGYFFYFAKVLYFWFFFFIFSWAKECFLVFCAHLDVRTKKYLAL